MTINAKSRTPLRETSAWQAYFASRYAILFYALLLTLAVMPAAPAIGLPPILIKLLLGVSLVTAVMPNATRRSRYAFFGAIVGLIVAGLAVDFGYLPVNSGLALTLSGLIGLLAAAGTLRFTVQSDVVDSETLYAALSTYLLAGLFFGQIYWAIETFAPGSLVGPDPTTEATSVYYSFVTLATLGYGDYLPRSDIARGVATFEVIGGQLFLAVMVARLIGAFESKSA